MLDTKPEIRLSQSLRPLCEGLTKAGAKCRRHALPGRPWCGVHHPLGRGLGRAPVDINNVDGPLVYVIGEPGGPVKIGAACSRRQLRNRWHQLQCANPRQLCCYAIIPGASESELHVRFAADRIRGEWFHLTEAIQALIDEYRYEGQRP